jgi:outer membrane protein OmpA-like peptidoglycan-associated protein
MAPSKEGAFFWEFNVRQLITFLAVIFTFNAWAIDLKGYQFTDSYRYSILEDSYSERFNGKNVWLGSFAHVHNPFYYTDEDINEVQNDIISYNNVLTLGYTRYISDKLAMGLDIVGVQNKVLDESYTSLGDVNLRAKYLLSDRGDDVGFSINPFLTIPTGRRKNFTTARTVSGGIRAVLEKHWTRWHVLGSLGYAHAPKAEYEIVDQRNVALTQLGLSYDLNADWNANIETYRNFTLNADERQDEGDYYVTLKNKTTTTISLYGGAGIAGTDEVERNNYTVFAGFKLQEAETKPEPTKPAPVAQKPAPVARPVTRSQENAYGSMIELDNVYFGNNSFVVTPVEREKVMKVVRAYKRLGEKFSKVVIEGFASTRGNTVKNEILSQQRTKEVMNILKAEGIPEEKMSLVSYGDQGIQDPQEWKNRKVQFRIYRN